MLDCGIWVRACKGHILYPLLLLGFSAGGGTEMPPKYGTPYQQSLGHVNPLTPSKPPLPPRTSRPGQECGQGASPVMACLPTSLRNGGEMIQLPCGVRRVAYGVSARVLNCQEITELYVLFIFRFIGNRYHFGRLIGPIKDSGLAL